VRRSTPANLSSVEVARDGTGQAELESLKAQLEAARQAAGEAIGVFYDPRQNAEHAANLQRSHRLKGRDSVAGCSMLRPGAGQHRVLTSTIDRRRKRSRKNRGRLRIEPMLSSGRSYP